MKVSTATVENRLLVKLTGELDNHAAKSTMMEISQEIAVTAPRDCVLDLKGLTFMDSSGIALIIKTYKLMRETGGSFWIENAQPQPLRVLEASGVGKIIPIAR